MPLIMALAVLTGRPTSTVHAAPPLAALAVRVSDLPPGFYLFHTKTTGGSAPSYDRLFLRRSWATGGWTLVENQLFAYPNAAAAARAFARRRVQLAHSGVVGTTTVVIRPVRHPTPVPANPHHPPPPKPERYHPMIVPQLGDQAAGFTVVSAGYASEYAFTNDLVLFRRGPLCEVLRVVGFYGQVAPADFVRLAERLDARARAGRG
jgi:hypothetical protein